MYKLALRKSPSFLNRRHSVGVKVSPMIISSGKTIITRWMSTVKLPDIVTINEAQEMPRSYNNMPNDILLTMAVMGDQDAREERVIREIMAVDKVEWHQANEAFEDIKRVNRQGLGIATIPYKLGVATSVIAAFVSIPMIFDLNTVMWFNEFYVTTDVPEPKDLETPLEVGSWAWNWMEPPLGEISFFLLCMQFARAQMQNLDAKPYNETYKTWRARRLLKAFPKYDKNILTSFSKGDSLKYANIIGYKD